MYSKADLESAVSSAVNQTMAQMQSKFQDQLAAKPKEPLFLRMLPSILVVLGWAATMLIWAGYAGQRLNNLEAGLQKVNETSLPALVIQAKFDAVIEQNKAANERMSRIEGDIANIRNERNIRAHN